MAKPFAVSDAEFNEKVVEADKPVLVWTSGQSGAFRAR